MARPRVPAVAVLAALISLGFLGGGAFILLTQQTGAPARATVTGCDQGRRYVHCTGTWTAGGGRVVRGTIEGADTGDLGETLDVRLSGDRAYTTSRRLPLVLIGIGLTVAVLGGIELRKHSRTTARLPPG
jgi:hypothetical protein